MSYENLSELLSKIEKLAGTANIGHDSDSFAQKLEIEKHGAKVSYWGQISDFRLDKAPSGAESVTYTYTHSDAPPSPHTAPPLSRVMLILNDDVRFLLVEGSSSEQVDALVSMASESLQGFEVLLGGYPFRAFFGGLALLALVIIGGVLWFATLTPRRSGLLVATSITMSVCSLLVNSQALFPGVAVYSGEVSFIARNAYVISFWGLVLTMIGFPFSIMVSRRWFPAHHTVDDKLDKNTLPTPSLGEQQRGSRRPKRNPRG